MAEESALKQHSRATISDVARFAGVAPMTVSRVLTGSAKVADSTADRVRHAVQLLKYEPNQLARELRAQPSKSVALILPRISDQVAMRYAQELLRLASEQQQELAVSISDGRPESARALVIRAVQRGSRGIIIIPDERDSSLTPADLEGVSVIALQRSLPGLRVDSVLPQDRQGARLAVKHLLGHQCERILFFTRPEDLSRTQERREGYREAMDYTSRQPEELLLGADQDLQGLLSAHLRNRPDAPLGLITANVESTLILLRSLGRLHQQLGQQVRVIGFDDFETADLLAQPITTVAQPFAEMSGLAFNLLLNKISGATLESEQTVLSVPMKLIQRCSCGCGETA